MIGALCDRAHWGILRRFPFQTKCGEWTSFRFRLDVLQLGHGLGAVPPFPVGSLPASGFLGLSSGVSSSSIDSECPSIIRQRPFWLAAPWSGLGWSAPGIVLGLLGPNRLLGCLGLCVCSARRLNFPGYSRPAPCPVGPALQRPVEPSLPAGPPTPAPRPRLFPPSPPPCPDALLPTPVGPLYAAPSPLVRARADLASRVASPHGIGCFVSPCRKPLPASLCHKTCLCEVTFCSCRRNEVPTPV